MLATDAEKLIHRPLIGIGELVLTKFRRSNPAEVTHALGADRTTGNQLGGIERQNDFVPS